MNVLFVKTSSSMVGKKLSETKLLTLDDLLFQDRMARKHRWTMSSKQNERRQMQVLGQLLRKDGL